jgi:hypothetical protein
VDAVGKIVREVKAASEPAALLAELKNSEEKHEAASDIDAEVVESTESA